MELPLRFPAARALHVARSMRAEGVGARGFDRRMEERIVCAMTSKMFARCIG
jgi:hypothetical protein